MNLNELCRIVLPNENFVEYPNLFINLEDKTINFEGKFQAVKVCKTNTWMNSFPIKKYVDFCNIPDFYLHINVNVKATIQIFNYTYNEAFSNSELIITEKLNPNEDSYIKIENPEKYENLYFSLICDKKEDLIFNNASWCTTGNELSENKLAIVICTFKRENYVKRNIDLFNNFIAENPNLSDKIKMFIVDNGKTLDKSLENSNIKIFPNKNSGGAGGFTRGIIEAKKENYTRILLMDDDVEVFAESFYRTLKLSNYLKPEYQKSFIHGAMLSLYCRNMFTESAAYKTKNWVRSYHSKTDISITDNIAKINYIPSKLFENENVKISSAWWYCCFSIDSIKEKGLPLPVFFRCDDIEWSWRNFGEHHISMNGICVWHTPFEWRVSKPVEYYFSKRNYAMINMLYTKNYKKQLLKMLKGDFKHLLRCYDYTSCNLYIRMMKDLLKGKETYFKDPEVLMKEIFEYTKSDKKEDFIDTAKYKYLKQKYNLFMTDKKQYRSNQKLNHILSVITLGGKLLPKPLWQKEKYAWSDTESSTEFKFAKKVYVVNFLTNKFETREKNSNIEKELNKNFKNLYKKIDKNYNNLKSTFSQMKEECSTEEFWKKYLEI